jgi:hypothetical protein
MQQQQRAHPREDPAMTQSPAERRRRWQKEQIDARSTRRKCGQRITNRPDDHPCAKEADGHTMHRCARGDCEWGHY